MFKGCTNPPPTVSFPFGRYFFGTQLIPGFGTESIEYRTACPTNAPVWIVYFMLYCSLGLGGGGGWPDGLFAQQEREPIRGRPAVRGKRTYGGRPGQRPEEQGTWASRTEKHSEAGYGRPVDRGAWTAKTVKRPRQQPAQPQHTNYWAPRTRKRHQQEHRPQRPTESSNLTQHAKGGTGNCQGPRKGTTTRRDVTQGVFISPSRQQPAIGCETRNRSGGQQVTQAS